MGLVQAKLVALLTTALVAAVLSTPPAAQADPRPDVRRGGNHFPASVETEVPPGGYATITSPTIPKSTKTLVVTLVAKANATKPEVEAFDQLGEVMGKMTKGKRLLTCIMLFNAAVTVRQAEDDYDADVQFQANEAIAALVVLVACVRLAGLVTSTDGAADRGTGLLTSPGVKMAPCIQDKPGVPATLEQADDGSWILDADGALKKTRNKVKIGCQTMSGKTVLKVRAAKKGVPLRKVLGKTPRLSLVSPADAESGAPTKVTFSLP
jgi:hypothetical protein